MDLEITGGALAVSNGGKCEDMVASLLGLHGYKYNSAKTLNGLMMAKENLWAIIGQYSRKCRVPLLAQYHQGRNRFAEVDFVILNKMGDAVLLSVKSQQSNGTAQEKLEYEVQQLIATELPAAMLVYGPIKGREAKTGWDADVLGEMWERARHFGASRVLLFRSPARLATWIEAGLPVSGRGVTSTSIFTQYCDREP